LKFPFFAVLCFPSTAPFPPYTVSVDATYATLDPTDPLLSCNAAGNDDGSQTVWYEYTPVVSGFVDFNTVGSTEAGGGELGTAHGAFTGGCDALVQVACVDEGLTDHLYVEVAAGTTYYIKVGQFAGGNDAGTVQLNVEEGSPPVEPAKLVIESSRNSRNGTSAPLRDIVGRLAPRALTAARTGNALDALREIPNFSLADGMAPDSNATGPVGSLVDVKGAVKYGDPANLLQIFEGGENDDNWTVLGTLIAPPDTNGEVGKDHFVQTFNLLTQIFDKDGNSVLGPFPTSAFFAGLGGNCEISDDGDPIVLYDDEAPFRATFIVLVDERQVAQFKSDKKGNFEVLLPAGNYTIVPDKSTPIPAPQSQTKTVTVPEDGFAVITLRFDTGMR
jgi:hypothetical protein